MKVFYLFFILVLLSSCITKSLWSGPSYEEQILNFFVGSDGRYIVFVSKDYHYIFTDNSGVLKDFLSLKQQGILTLKTDETYIKLDSNNNLKGYLVFSGPFEVLPHEDIIKLETMGLKPDKDDNILIKIPLIGRRYTSRYLGQEQPLAKNINYKILVYYSDFSLAKNMGKAAITPVTVTLDAVVLIGKIVIAPFEAVY